jgi:polyisoprenoid-binding protein YceI
MAMAQGGSMSTYQLDGANHSVVSFAVDYVGGKFKASIAPISATLELEDSTGSLTGSAPATGITVRDENLRGHLLSPDFFNAENAPELTFKSNELKVDGEKISVKGDLTLRGETHPVEAHGTVRGPVIDQFGQQRLGVVLETTVDRSKYGFDWNADTPTGNALANDVAVTADLFFVAQS